MLVFERVEDIVLPEEGGPVHVAVGTFDGVHRAHQTLIRRLADAARADGGRAMIFTFQNHPRSVVAPGECPGLLTPWPVKRRLMEALPLDVLAGIRFDSAFAATPAPDFIREVLRGRCRASVIYSGRNFHFGQGGKGGPPMLADMAVELGYRYEQLEPVTAGGERISSTRVRERLAAGDVAEAADLLGRPHQLTGPVVTGDRIGRTIGFPTANLAVPAEVLLPADGVYAVGTRIEGDDTVRPGMMNIGWRPTVGGRDHRVEVHLIGWEGDLANRELTVLFASRLRGEKKFSGMEELKAQLIKDREAAAEELRGFDAQPV